MRLARFLAALLLPLSSALAQTAAFLPDYLPTDPSRYCTRVYSFSLGMGGGLISDLGGELQIPYLSGPVSAMWVNGWPQNPGERLAFANDSKQVIIPAAIEVPGTGSAFLSRDCYASGPPDGRSFDSVLDGTLIEQGPGYASIGGECRQVMGSGRILVEVQNLVVHGARYDNAVVIWMLDTAKPYHALTFEGKDEETGLRPPISDRTSGAAITEFIAFGKDTGAIAGGDINAGTGRLTTFWELTGATCADGAVPLETGLWTATGPPGWQVSALAVHPREPSIILAGSPYGITRSSDAGDTWHPANTGLRVGDVRAIVFAPSSPDTVYAATWNRGLFRSSDAGRSWVRVSTLRNISSLAVHPSDPRTLYIAGTEPDSYGNAGYSSDGIFVTHDGGSSLTSLGSIVELGPSATSFTTVAVVPDVPAVICAGISSITAGEVYCRSEESTKWTRVFRAGAQTERFVAAIHIDPEDSRVAFILCEGLYKTQDGGGTWSRVVDASEPTGLSEPENGLGGASLYVDAATGDLYIGARGGVLRSTDGGDSWQPGAYSYDLMETAFRSLGMSRGRLFAGIRDGGILGSIDNGLTWEVAQAGQYTFDSVHASLSKSGDVIGGDRFYGFFRSRGGTGTWEHVPGVSPGTVFSIVSTPDAPERLFASTNRDGLLRSDDAGETWTKTGVRVTAFTIDGANSSRFYGQIGNVVWKSEDAGATWNQVAPAPRPGGRSVFAVEPGPSGKLYVGYALMGGLYVWTPEGGGWKRLAEDNLKLSNVQAIAVQPSPGGAVWIGTGSYLEPDAGYGKPGGLWVSSNGGDALDEVKLPLTVSSVTKILFDHFEAATIYAFGYVMDSNAAALFVSNDSGSTWRAYPETDMGEIEQLALDPASPGRIYAASDSGLKMIQIGAPAIVQK